MISENLDGKGGTMEVMSSCFEGMDNSQEFTVIDVIIPFCQREELRKVGAGIPFAVQVSLEEDSTRHIFRCIGGNSEGRGEVRYM